MVSRAAWAQAGLDSGAHGPRKWHAKGAYLLAKIEADTSRAPPIGIVCTTLRFAQVCPHAIAHVQLALRGLQVASYRCASGAFAPV